MRWWIAGLLLIALAACGKAAAPSAPAEVAVIEPAFGSQLERGSALFEAHCASCHGSDGAGRGPFPALSSGQHAFQHPDWELIALIRDGKNAMPAFGDRLSEAEIIDIIARVKAWWGPGELSEQRQLCILSPAPTPAQ